MRLEVTISGVTQVVARLGRAAKSIDERTDPILEDVANNMLADMIRDIPKDRPRTVDTLGVIRNGPNDYMVGAIGGTGAKRAGSPAFIARLLETGTSKMPPRPFIEPAAQTHGPKLVDRLRREATKI